MTDTSDVAMSVVPNSGSLISISGGIQLQTAVNSTGNLLPDTNKSICDLPVLDTAIESCGESSRGNFDAVAARIMAQASHNVLLATDIHEINKPPNLHTLINVDYFPTDSATVMSCILNLRLVSGGGKLLRFYMLNFL
jgi:hypothetical protein